MRIAIRNLGGAKHPGAARFRTEDAQRESWSFLASLGADVVLAQETVAFGDDIAAPDGWVTSLGQRQSDWLSVIAARVGSTIDLTWRPSHPVLDGFGSYLAFGLASVGTARVGLVSVHAPHTLPAEVWGTAGIEMPRGKLRPWPSDVLLDALGEALRGTSAVIAGDWNEAPRWPTPGDAGTKAFFDRATALGWTEAVSATFGGEVRTCFANRSPGHQNDHIFVTADLWPNVAACGVVGEPRRTRSDHSALLLDLDL